jgi:hypothetical protein
MVVPSCLEFSWSSRLAPLACSNTYIRGIRIENSHLNIQYRTVLDSSRENLNAAELIQSSQIARKPENEVYVLNASQQTS